MEKCTNKMVVRVVLKDEYKATLFNEVLDVMQAERK